MKSKRVNLTIRAFDESERRFVESSHQVHATRFTTVLGALIDIKEKEDQSISMRYSCRMGVCGSCGMVINGKPMLACQTKVMELGDSIMVEPMQGHQILRGLVSDFDEFFSKHKAVRPWIIRLDAKEKFHPTKEFMQSDKQRDMYLPFSQCIKCGLCVDACPVSNTNKDFLGPQALAQGYRYYADSRDQGGSRRLDYLDSMDGAWGCEFAGACSKVCPASVDPALAIQLLKSEIAKRRLLGRKD